MGLQLPIINTRRRVIHAADRQEGIPLSFAQRGLWLLEQMLPGSSAYNVPFAVRLDGPLDVNALSRALERVTARQESLRTMVRVQQREPWQHFSPEPQVVLPVTDLADLQDAVREQRSASLVDAWAHEPFDLAAGPLMRTRLIRLGEDAHILVLVMHHIICDGQSIHLFFDELAAEYAGEDLPSPPVVQYADYAAWQRRQVPDEGELDWWRQYLAGAPTALALPTDHPRPAVRSTAGATHIFRLPGALADDVGALAREMRLTPFMVMLSAYAGLVGRLTGAQDVLLGTPFSARPYPELEQLIGFFVNTLPVRVALDGDPTFAELLARVRASLLAVLSHQHVPFDMLVESLQVDRSPSHTPLIQSVFTYEPRPLAEPHFAGVTAELLTLRANSAKFDLDFMIVQAADDSGELEGAINYSTGLFNADTIERLADRFHRLLAAAVAAPHTPLRSLPLLAEEERSTIVGKWSATGAARQSDTLVAELFSEQAATTPDAPAASIGETVVSYGELDARSERLACHLQSLGVEPDDVVGILLPRGIDLVTAVLGVMKAGAAYLPLDPNHPAGHLARVMAMAGAGLVISDSQTSRPLVGTDAEALCLDTLALDGGPPAAARRRARPENLAYVIFTSGSTGEPKGVGIPHRALANHAQAMRDRFALTPDDRVLQFANIGFDVAAEELFPTWLAGGCVVLCADPPPPDALVTVLNGGAVTVANLPSSYWQQSVTMLDLGGEFPAPTLRLLVVGSESVDAAALATWCRRTRIPVLNAYGLTEASITASVHPVEAALSGNTVPIGRPIDGVEAYVLDAHLEPVPAGVEGELYLGGAGLARGYLARSDLTADRFVPHPFATVPGARLHRTGDRARWRPDGALEVLGRIDEQLKVRGYRIEPAEVEAALCSHPGIAQAAVVADDGRLIGYVVPRSGGAVPPDLLGHVAGRLPAYLVPGALVALEALPVSASGKVDRKRLPAPSAPAAAQAVPARTDLERRLAGLWQEVLDLERVGIYDNFFDLGGNSFALATVHARLSDLLGRRLPMVVLYEHPTIAALAQHLSGDVPRAATGHPHPDDERASRLRARRARTAQQRRFTS